MAFALACITNAWPEKQDHTQAARTMHATNADVFDGLSRCSCRCCWLEHHEAVMPGNMPNTELTAHRI